MSKSNAFISFFITFVLFLAQSAVPVFAQSTGCFHTEIGNAPKDFKMPAECSSGEANDLIKAGEAAVKAYGACNGGSTNAGNESCMEDNLKKSGFSAKQVSAFAKRRPGSIVGCTQCLGFVGLVLALANSDPGSLAGIGKAAQVAGQGVIKSGSVSFAKVSGKPQPGDIGVMGGGVGHILIVKALEGNVKFVAVEANWIHCHATNNQSHLVSQFVYFRKK